MFLPLVPGQENAKDIFARALACGRLAHAYLFLGPPGSGKRLFAKELAKAIFCETASPCGACASCLAVEHGNHPQVFCFRPAEGKTVIDIDTVRALSERTHYKSKSLLVAVLEEANLLGEAAANAILKTLEEPLGDVLLILTAQSAGSLLPTIVSRCQRVRFRGAASSGAPEAAGGEPAALPEEVRAALADVLLPDFHARDDSRAWLGRAAPEAESAREGLRRLLGQLVAGGRPRLAALVGAPGFALDEELRRLEALIDLRQDLDRNVNPDLVLERLFTVLRR
jgi:hypothetical protein